MIMRWQRKGENMEYVGTRWYKCDFHLHTMSSECYADKNTYEEWVDEVCKKG